MSFFQLSDSTTFADILGYLIGAGSLLLYTPIAIRLWRQKSAEGLVLSTWWLKLLAYTASDIYGFTHGYPISTYIETLIMTVEAAVILCLVVYYQKLANGRFWCQVIAFFSISLCVLVAAPIQLIVFGQGVSSILNISALVPQFILNHRRQKAGDYSPITAGLATGGCLARIFTTIKLTNADGILLASFGLASLANAALLGQIIYLGTQIEGRTLRDVLTADSGRASTEIAPNETDYSDLSPYYREEEDIGLVDMQENSLLNQR